MGEPTRIPRPPGQRVPPEAPPPDDDASLVAALRSGDGAAFEAMVRAHSGRMLAVSRRILRSEDDARDAVQDAFISAYRSLGSFAGDAKLSTWLHRIVVNAALMKIRSRKRAAEEPLEDLLPSFSEDGHQADPAVDWTGSSHAAIEREETRALVRRCIDQLPESYRTILLLRDIEELDTEEAARLIGVTENAAKIRLHRARQALRTLLDRHLRGGAR